MEIIHSNLDGPICGTAGNNWDDHAVNAHVFNGLRYRCWAYDQAVTALIEDIHARGLAKRVMVVVTGEFGRTPKISFDRSTGAHPASGAAGTLQPGRDHWPGAQSILVSGGGTRGGIVVDAEDLVGWFHAASVIAPAIRSRADTD